MDIAQLRCFQAVAEELHFGRAADRLHMTASPVSRTVKDLERELGVELFIRGYHQVQLTPAGQELARRVPPLLAEFDRLRSEIPLVATGSSRAVRLGSSYMAPPGVLDSVVECAQTVRSVEVTLAPSAELLPALSRGELDVALVHLPVVDPDLDSLSLARYRFFVAMRSSDPLASRDSLTVAELAERAIVSAPLTPQPVAMQQLYDDLVGKGLRRLKALPSTDSSMMASHVRRTGDLAFTLAPSTGGSARVFDDPAFAVVPLTDSPTFRLGLVWPAGRADDPVVAGVVSAVRDRWAQGEIVI